MVKRLASLLILAWALGFLGFAIALPQPASAKKTDAVIALTGGEGRIARGLEVLDKGWSGHLLVSGVDPEVKPREFAAHYRVSAALMECCITLDFKSVDTRSNAREVSRWVAAHEYKSIRLITTDWHMRRAAFELGRAMPQGVIVTPDAVASYPSLETLFREYHKLLARFVSQAWGG
jgi:uncharacterized SAM-binding protein YcdF (DUF218 family)